MLYHEELSEFYRYMLQRRDELTVFKNVHYPKRLPDI